MNNPWKSARMSVRPAKTVHGVEIRKLPVGRYLETMDTLSGMTSELMTTLFPGMSPQEIVTQLTTLTQDSLQALAMRLLTALPQKLVALMASLLGVTEAFIREELSPNELVEVWLAFWELNDLTDFFGNVRKALPQALRTVKTTTTGSSASSQQGSR